MLDEWIKSFLSYIKTQKNYSAHTVISYAADLKALQEFLAERNSFDLDQFGINDFLSYLKQKNYSNRSIARKISTLRSFFKYISRTGQFKGNSRLTFKAPKFEQRLPAFLQERQMEDVMYLPTTKSGLGYRPSAGRLPAEYHFLWLALRNRDAYKCHITSLHPLAPRQRSQRRFGEGFRCQPQISNR